MKPYYEHAGITIYHGDCREVLPTIDPVDLVLTDPPYGIALESHRGSKGWDINGDNSQELGDYVLRSLWGYPMIVFASPKKPWIGDWSQYLVWWKGPAVGGGGEPSMYWKLDWELIQVRNLGRLNGSRDSSVLENWIGPTGSPYHPAQKPESLLLYLLGKVQAETILDPFMGSGTTLRAAKDLGRKAIGIEIEEKYCELAAKRLSQEVLAFE
jgi:DNA modification methylase